MLEPLRSVLSSKRIVLASGSPRRKEILQNAGIPKFEVIPATCEEDLDKSAYRERPWKYAEDTAELKARDVLESLRSRRRGDEAPLIVIGADTVVATADGTIFGKPADDADARKTLRALAGDSHKVHTGVSIFLASSSAAAADVRSALFHESTTVTFDALTDEVIAAYAATGEPRDKAGAYGIQALGGSLVRQVEGCYFNVVGFPLNRFCREMTALLKEEAC